jgi:RIO kinase 1
MSSEDFLDNKNLKRLDRELENLISRDGLDRKTLDQVFDKTTLHIFEKLISDKVLDILDFPISTGKEGNVFRGITPKKKLVAVKIYRINTATFKHITNYLYGDPRFESIGPSKHDIIYAWTKKEFKNLFLLHEIGIKVPKPIFYLKNVLIMEYIGSKNIPAPMMKDIILKNPKEIFDILVGYISKMYKEAKLVHSDFSQYNILIYRNKPYLIDLGQGVLARHPNALFFLKRDIKNLVNYFNKYRIRADAEKIYKTVTEK